MTTKRENTLGRKHGLDKRNWESRLKRLNINIEAGRNIYTAQMLKVFPFTKSVDFGNKVITPQGDNHFNIKVRELVEKGYEFVEAKAMWKGKKKK